MIATSEEPQYEPPSRPVRGACQRSGMKEAPEVGTTAALVQ